jgi:hypothetical protein
MMQIESHSQNWSDVPSVFEDSTGSISPGYVLNVWSPQTRVESNRMQNIRVMPTAFVLFK